MKRTLSLGVMTIALACAMVTYDLGIDKNSVEARGGKGGGKGGKGGKGPKGGKGGWGKPGTSTSVIPDYRLQRLSTFDLAEEEGVPLVLVFMSPEDALNENYYVDKEVADASREYCTFIKVLKGQTLMPEVDDDSGITAYGEDEEQEKKGKAKDDAAGKDGKDGDKADDKKADDKKEDGASDKPSDEESEDESSDEPEETEEERKAREAKEAEDAIPAPVMDGIPTQRLREKDLWISYKVEQTSVFIVTDEFGNEFKRFDKKPDGKSLLAAVKAVEKDGEKADKKLADATKKAQKDLEKGMQGRAVSTMLEAFEMGLFKREPCKPAAKLWVSIIEKGQDLLQKHSETHDVTALKKLLKEYEKTMLKTSIESAVRAAEAAAKDKKKNGK